MTSLKTLCESLEMTLSFLLRVITGALKAVAAVLILILAAVVTLGLSGLAALVLTYEWAYSGLEKRLKKD